MPIVEASTLINAPRPELFALAQDYGLRLKWDPFLREMKFRDGAQEAAEGVRVWVRAWNGLSMEVEYTTVKPPEVVAMKMLRGPFFFEQFAGSWRFKPGDGDMIEAIFRYSFTTRWPILRPLLDPLIRLSFQHDVRERLRGLKRGAEEMGLLAEMKGTP
jgi:ribosome-associated toxin RatA of RatAB toxin-antitoxin module